MASEIYLTLHHVPWKSRKAVRAYLENEASMEFDPDGSDTLIEGQWSAYNGGAPYALGSHLRDLGVAYDMSVRDDYDYTEMYDPKLGVFSLGDVEGGGSAVDLCDVESLRQCKTLREMRKRIDEITGEQWNRRFAAYAARRAKKKES